MKRKKMNNPRGIYLSPPGLGLANLFEDELGTNFNTVDLNYIMVKLPELFIQNLEIAKDVQTTTESNMFKVKTAGSIYQGLCNKTKDLLNICNSIGCPYCSSIAIILTRATGKPLVIESCQSREEKTVETTYRIIENRDADSAPNLENW